MQWMTLKRQLVHVTLLSSSSCAQIMNTEQTQQSNKFSSVHLSAKLLNKLHAYDFTPRMLYYTLKYTIPTFYITITAYTVLQWPKQTTCHHSFTTWRSFLRSRRVLQLKSYCLYFKILVCHQHPDTRQNTHQLKIGQHLATWATL